MEQEQKSANGLSRRELLKCGLYSSLAAGLSPSLWLSGCGKRQNAKKLNIILITLDTTRADRLGCYGHWRQTSPNIDKLAEESVIYKRAIATSSWTLPSHASLFTGKFTSSHGARYDPEGPFYLLDAIEGPELWRKYRARGLARDELTLASILQESGYETVAVVGSPWMKKVFGLNKGFVHYDDNQISTLNGRTAKQITESSLSWLKRLRKKDFFLFLNYFDPHFPYMAPEGFGGAFLPKGVEMDEAQQSVEGINALYDAEILYMDHYIGILLEQLRAENLYDNTLIIVTSDHGELLGEHGKFMHGKDLYQEEIHAPLLVKYPSGEVSASESEGYVQLTDILPMVCENLGMAVPAGIQGMAPPEITHPIIAETYPLPMLSEDGGWCAIYEGDMKFIWNSKGRHLLFDLEKDAGETVNLVQKEPDLVERLGSKLNGYLAGLPSPGPAESVQEVDEETKKALKSLGYVK